MRSWLACLSLLIPAAWGQQKTFLDEQLPLPPWLTLTAQARWRAEGQHAIGFRSGNDQDFLLQRLRAGIGVKPVPWLELYAETQDARSPGIPNATATTRNVADIRQAYVRLGREDSWFDVKVGRQVLAFGSERVLGGSDWTNTARVFDAVKLEVHHGGNRVDIFSSSVVNPDREGWDHHAQGDNLHGGYASIATLVPKAKFEPYVLWRFSPRFNGDSVTGHYRSVTVGARLAGTLRSDWAYELEILGQGGRISGQQLAAWGAEAQVRRQFPRAVWKPSLLAEYNFASGDRQRHDGPVNTLDQLYPTNHSIYGVVDAFGRRNMKNLRFGVWGQPRTWLTLKLEGHDFWLASRNDALYAATGAVSVAAVPGGALSRHVGKELDMLADVKLSRHYSLGAQFGHLFAGQFLRLHSPGSGRTFYAMWVDFRL